MLFKNFSSDNFNICYSYVNNTASVKNYIHG